MCHLSCLCRALRSRPRSAVRRTDRSRIRRYRQLCRTHALRSPPRSDARRTEHRTGTPLARIDPLPSSRPPDTPESCWPCRLGRFGLSYRRSGFARTSGSSPGAPARIPGRTRSLPARACHDASSMCHLENRWSGAAGPLCRRTRLCCRGERSASTRRREAPGQSPGRTRSGGEPSHSECHGAHSRHPELSLIHISEPTRP